MVRSMTGYGKAEAANDKYVFSVELKAVNHRYLDVSIRLPKVINSLESKIRQIVKDRLDRGKVDIYINYRKEASVSGGISFDAALVKAYLDCFSQMENEFGIVNDIKMSVMSRLPNVIIEEEDIFEDEDVWELLSDALNSAIDAFIAEREREGEKLKEDLLNKLSELHGLVDEIEKVYPSILEEYKQKLATKIEELLGNTTIEENRILAEVTLYADKTCVDEETVRLKTHIESMADTLKKGGVCGKKLDFITQEMNREANTILSKSNTISITDTGIALKTGIEKVREQIQNIE